jgi:CRISPR-associated DxTHG motif protein
MTILIYKGKNMANKKAVITILGKGFVTDEDKRAKYSFEKSLDFNLEKENYTNMFPLLIQNFKDYEVVPIFTDEAKNTNQEVLISESIKFDCFNENYHISTETKYDKILKLINSAIEKYDQVIFDVSHGFRHLPILATVSLIIQNIKNIDKVKHIFFAKEKIKADKNTIGKYKIIDLLNYLDLANVSFLVTNFKDNYTTSRHIQVKNEEYKNLIESMNKFSADLMALSLENLLENSSKKLLYEIDNLLEDKNRVLSSELKELKKHLKNIFSKKAHRYETYFYLAKDLEEKGYLALTLSLLFEGFGFYLKTSFSNYDTDIENTINKYEKKIISKQPKNDEYPDRLADYYDITNACRTFIIKDEDKNRNNIFKSKEQKKTIYKQLKKIKTFEDIKFFNQSITDLRNNLLHANSGKQIRFTNQGINIKLKEYQKICIDEDIFSISPYIPKITDEGIKKSEERRLEKLAKKPKNFKKV